jgi:hypothetical protein
MAQWEPERGAIPASMAAVQCFNKFGNTGNDCWRICSSERWCVVSEWRNDTQRVNSTDAELVLHVSHEGEVALHRKRIYIRPTMSV